MKLSVKRIALLLAAVLFLCLWLTPVALAETSAEETTPEATAEATEAPTEKPKVSAADLQAQGILTVGAKGEDVKKCQQRLKDLG